MGTELQYVLNLLSTLSTKHGDIVKIRTAEFSPISRKGLLKDKFQTGFSQIQESMERMLEQHNRESMKKTMLKQEEIFKEQVRELHRLYRVQKELMAEVRNELKLSSLANAVPRSREIQTQSAYLNVDAPTALRSASTGSPTSHSPLSHHISTQINSYYDFHQCLKSRTSTSSQEQTSSSRDTLRLHREFDLEQPAEGDTSTNINVANDQDPTSHRFTKSKTTINDPHCVPYCDDAENEIELTLSIGYNTDKKEQKHWSHTNLEVGCSEWNPDETRQLIPSTTIRSDRDEGCSDAIASAAFERESTQRPQWLFQSMSLNKT